MKNEDFDDTKFEDFGIVDMQLKPEFFIFNCLKRCPNCFQKEDVNGGLLQFRMLVEHIETLCIGSNIIDEKDIKNVKDESNEVIDLARNGNEKLKSMLPKIFESRKMNMPISTKEKKTKDNIGLP